MLTPNDITAALALGYAVFYFRLPHTRAWSLHFFFIGEIVFSGVWHVNALLLSSGWCICIMSCNIFCFWLSLIIFFTFWAESDIPNAPSNKTCKKRSCCLKVSILWWNDEITVDAPETAGGQWSVSTYLGHLNEMIESNTGVFICIIDGNCLITFYKWQFWL